MREDWYKTGGNECPIFIYETPNSINILTFKLRTEEKLHIIYNGTDIKYEDSRKQTNTVKRTLQKATKCDN